MVRLKHSQAVWLMVVVTAMWSIAGVVTRHLEQARSFEVTFWRSFFTALSLLVLLPLWRGPGVFRRLPWRNRLFWISGLCWSVMFTAFMVALTLTTVANVLLTLSIGPLVTALFSRVFIGHHLPPRTWGAIAVAGTGIAWMQATQVALGQPGAWSGFLVALCVPLAGGVQWTMMQHTHARSHSTGFAAVPKAADGTLVHAASKAVPDASPEASHGASHVASPEAPPDLVPSVLLGALLSSLLTLPLALPLQATGHDVGLLAMLGLVQLAIPCALSVVCASVLKAPEVSLLALLEVLFGIVLAWVGAGEAPGPNVLTGGALVIGALVVNEWLGWKQRSAEPNPLEIPHVQNVARPGDR